MKKIIFAAAAALIFSSAMGIASAYDYNTMAKKAAKSGTCACAKCTCPDCRCTDCSTGACDEHCSKGGSQCGSGCCKK